MAGERANEYEEILGYHLERAHRYLAELGPLDERGRELASRAAARLGSSGGRALARGDIGPAVNLLERAVSLLAEDDPVRRDLTVKLGIALAESGQLSRADALLHDRIEAERRGSAYVVFQDATAKQQVVTLEDDQQKVTIGRRAENDIALAWDQEVSREHAELLRGAEGWTLVDEGSRNGSYLNGQRVSGRHPLRDGDVLRFGDTVVLFRAPVPDERRKEVSLAPDQVTYMGGSPAAATGAIMRDMAGNPVTELKARTEAERSGVPFVLYRDGEDHQRLFSFERDVVQASVGRRETADLVLDWDDQVSRLHAQFERVEQDWTVVDDGLSRNGTFVNGERLSGRRRLSDGDSLRFGGTTMIFRSPQVDEQAGTAVASQIPTAVDLSTTQRRVLVALCRPYKDGTAFASPGHQPADRRRAVPLGRRGEDPPQGAVREVRYRAAAPEPEAHPTGRAGVLRRHHLRARPLVLAPGIDHRRVPGRVRRRLGRDRRALSRPPAAAQPAGRAQGGRARGRRATRSCANACAARPGRWRRSTTRTSCRCTRPARRTGPSSSPRAGSTGPSSGR